MFKSINSPGAIVKVSMGLYDHYAIVSDRWYIGKTNAYIIVIKNRYSSRRVMA